MIDEKELGFIRDRINDLRKFWGDWGYTDVRDMPIYMQDLCKLLDYVDMLRKKHEPVIEFPKPEEKIETDGLDGKP